MNNLPIFQDPNKNLMLLQTNWKTALTPILQSELNQGSLLSVTLASGANTINHLLNRMQIGWIIADIDASATIYRSHALNDKTLTLNSSAPCNVKIWVF